MSSLELVLTAVPFGVVTRTVDEDDSPIRERFRRGAFRDTDPLSVQLLSNHRPGSIGVITALNERSNSLAANAHLFYAFDWMMREVDEGNVGVSIGFVPVLDRESHDDDGPIVERLAVRLKEVSLTTHPAYSDTQARTRQSVEEARAREWVKANRRRRFLGLDPAPFPTRAKAKAKAKAAPSVSPETMRHATDPTRLHYAGGGRVLGIS